MIIYAQPPEPELGYRWVLNPKYSDEFNGNSLDKSKWRDSFDGWKGRSPAKFDPTTVSVQNGNMQIQNKKLAQVDGDYTIGGGAVQSLGEDAFFGYYECSFKASKINMSTTFWMSNGKVAVNGITKKSNGIDCDKDRYSQELDICESVGGTGNFSSKFRTQQNFNTHYRYIDCNGSPEKFYSAGNNAIEGNGQQANANIDGESWQDFHTYACYWKNANVVDFYTDKRFAGSVKVSTDVVDSPFPRPMKINMVTETYTWAKPYPADVELANNNINTSYYDWIRSYYLVPIDQDLGTAAAGFVNIYSEKSNFINFETNRASATIYSFDISHQTNLDRDLYIIIKNQVGVIKETKVKAYTGYGRKLYTIDLNEALPDGNYSVEIQVRPIDGNASSTIHTSSETMIVGEGGSPLPSVTFSNPEMVYFTSTEISYDVKFTTEIERDLVLVLTTPNGDWLGSKTQTVQAGTAMTLMTINLNTAPPVGENYKLSAVLRVKGGDWKTNVVTKDILVKFVTPATCTTEDNYNECFEGDGLSTWGGWGNAVRETTMNPEHVASGNFAMKISGPGAGNFTVEGLMPNTTYELSGFTKIIGTDPINFGVKGFDDANTDVYINNINTIFEEKRIQFSTDANHTSAQIYFFSPKTTGEGYLDDIKIRMQTITSLEDLANNGSAIYPNPSSDKLYFRVQKDWLISTIYGDIIRSGNETEIDISALSNGVYLITQGENVYRFVKN